MTQKGVITYPTPVFSNNIPIQSQFFEPSQFFISGISTGVSTVVMTSIDHNYVLGQLCRLIIPTTSGSRQLNQKSGYVISIPASNQVELNINSQNTDPFFVGSGRQLPQIVAIGDRNNGQINANGPNMATFIAGSFINTSP